MHSNLLNLVSIQMNSRAVWNGGRTPLFHVIKFIYHISRCRTLNLQLIAVFWIILLIYSSASSSASAYSPCTLFCVLSSLRKLFSLRKKIAWGEITWKQNWMNEWSNKKMKYIWMNRNILGRLTSIDNHSFLCEFLVFMIRISFINRLFSHSIRAAACDSVFFAWIISTSLGKRKKRKMCVWKTSPFLSLFGCAILSAVVFLRAF